MAYDRVHECLTSVLCRFLIYEVFVHAAADTQGSNLMHLLDMHSERHASPRKFEHTGNFMLIERRMAVMAPSTFRRLKTVHFC